MPMAGLCLACMRRAKPQASTTRSTQAPLQCFAGQSSEKLLAKTPPHYLADAGVDEEAAIGAGAASTLPGIALAQPTTKWSPSSPIKMVVPYTAGGGTDVLARLVSYWQLPSDSRSLSRAAPVRTALWEAILCMVPRLMDKPCPSLQTR